MIRPIPLDIFTRRFFCRYFIESDLESEEGPHYIPSFRENPLVSRKKISDIYFLDDAIMAGLEKTTERFLEMNKTLPETIKRIKMTLTCKPEQGRWLCQELNEMYALARSWEIIDPYNNDPAREVFNHSKTLCLARDQIDAPFKWFIRNVRTAVNTKEIFNHDSKLYKANSSLYL